MSDSRSAYDEQLPWLEAVDDEDGPRGVPARRMLAALLVVLLAAALVSATFFWLGRRNAADTAGAPELIKAEPGTTRQELYTMAVDTALAQIGIKRAFADRIVLFFSLEPNELPD